MISDLWEYHFPQERPCYMFKKKYSLKKKQAKLETNMKSLYFIFRMISGEYSVANEDKTGLYKIVYIKSFRRIQGNIVTKLLPYCNKTVTHSSSEPVKTLLFFYNNEDLYTILKCI